MAMGGEPVEARNTGGAEAMETRGKAPVAGGRGTTGSDDLATGIAAGGYTDVERCLARFAKAAASSPQALPKIPTELDGVLAEISAVGVPYYGWGGLKELLAARMVEAVGALEKEVGFRRAIGGKGFKERRDELVASLRSFDAAPFTLQRLAEVLQEPRRQYSSTHKLINGLERLLAVSSTLPTRSRRDNIATTCSSSDASSGALKAAHDSSAMSNGSAITSTAKASLPDRVTAGVSVSVKVEQAPATEVPTEVPTEEKSVIADSSEEGWELDESSSDRGQGPGRKRMKVGLSKEAPAMSE